MFKTLLVAVIAAGLPIADGAGQERALDVQAREFVLSPRRIELELTLRNSAAVPLEFYASDLPWGVPHSLDACCGYQ